VALGPIDWPRLSRLAEERFGIQRFRPGQRDLIEAVLSGQGVQFFDHRGKSRPTPGSSVRRPASDRVAIARALRDVASLLALAGEPRRASHAAFTASYVSLYLGSRCVPGVRKNEAGEVGLTGRSGTAYRAAVGRASMPCASSACSRSVVGKAASLPRNAVQHHLHPLPRRRRKAPRPRGAARPLRGSAEGSQPIRDWGEAVMMPSPGDAALAASSGTRIARKDS
jgi:hypothetical protein